MSSGSHVFSSDANFTNIEIILSHSTAGSNVDLSAQTEGFTITGGAGIDTIKGGLLANIITGGGGKDIITGGASADTITGGADDDDSAPLWKV